MRDRKSVASRDKMASMLTWLPLVRAAAVGWVPLSTNPMSMSAPDAPERRVGSPGVSADARLRINISGQRFEAWRAMTKCYRMTSS